MVELKTVKHFEDLLKDAIAETGADLKGHEHAIALYMSERAFHLSTIVNEPGFAQAVRAERNSVALRAGLELSDTARAVDVKILGLIQGALFTAANLLA